MCGLNRSYLPDPFLIPPTMHQGAGPLGAGDLLYSFLGSVILSMGFRIYDQRETMKRHAPEIIGATFASALFSFFSTAFAAKALGLQSCGYEVEAAGRK